VFVDTPGIHKPRTAFGTRMNNVARDSYEGVDVVVLVIDSCAKIGSGDARLAAELGPSTIVAINKSDRANPATIAAQLAAAGAWEFAEYFPISALTGEGTDELLKAMIARLPEGPQLYPPDHVSDTAESVWVAELVREQLLAVTRQELPHAIHTQVVEWDGPRIRCEILVERESQKPMVIGKGGLVLKEVGIRARAQLPEGTFLELHVRVEPRWQRRPDIFDRIGTDSIEREMP
jgi:GTP-binding protein Era